MDWNTAKDILRAGYIVTEIKPVIQHEVEIQEDGSAVVVTGTREVQENG